MDMKKYDREKREWIDEEEYNRRIAKRSECKKDRKHDYVEVLPWGVNATEKYEGLTEPYYEAMKAIADFSENKYKELDAMGIVVTYRPWRPDASRLYRCAVCKKQKYS